MLEFISNQYRNISIMNGLCTNLILNLLFFPIMINTESVTFRNTTVAILVIRELKGGGLEEKVSFNKILENSNTLMNIFDGEDENTGNAIEIKNQQIPIIYENAFLKLKLLKLSILDCDTEILEKGAFNELVQLDSFVMKNTQLTVVLRGVFENLPIATIDMSTNKIRVIESRAFAGLTSLTDLILNGNLMKELRKGVFLDLPNLKRLNLNDNEIKEIERGTFENLPKLYQLLLKGNQLKTIIAGVFSEYFIVPF